MSKTLRLSTVFHSVVKSGGRGRWGGFFSSFLTSRTTKSYNIEKKPQSI